MPRFPGMPRVGVFSIVSIARRPMPVNRAGMLIPPPTPRFAAGPYNHSQVRRVRPSAKRDDAERLRMTDDARKARVAQATDDPGRDAFAGGPRGIADVVEQPPAA